MKPWKPAPSPLSTRWSKAVSPTRVRPEYPRPQLVRQDWLSLNGLWEFAFDGERVPTAFPEQILVPFTFESSLSGIGKGKEIHERVWYRRTFTVPQSWGGKRVLLHFGAVDWQTTVWVNGKRLGEHTGAYTPFSFDITDALTPGENTLVVGVYDPADPSRTGWQPKGKQLGSAGIWYTRTTGIWQSVWLEPVNRQYLRSVRFETEPATGQVSLQWVPGMAYPNAASVGKVELQVLDSSGREVAQATAEKTMQYELRARVPDVRLWSPESPTLYDVVVRLRDSKGALLDEVRSYVAFRSVGIANGRLTLNGKPYFYRGVLDQGYWPDGILTPPTDDAIRADVEAIKQLGWNMARKHIKVEDPRWYYWCDKLGVAVWQDMPSAHNLSKAEARTNFTKELTEIIGVVQHYHCVVHWIPFNENWGNPQAFQDEMVTLSRRLWPGIPITDASGWTQRTLTDVIDAHNYSNNLKREGVANPRKPKVIGEFGGIALGVTGHTWSQGWGYQTAGNPDALLSRLRRQLTQVFEAENLSGYVYTQLTDVEQELNGVLTYDRLPKTGLNQFARIFEGKERIQSTPALADWLVLGPLPAGTTLTTANDNAANQAQLRKILATAFVPAEATLDPRDGESLAGQRWRRVREEVLDFHRIFGRQTDNAAAYAVAVFDSPRAVRNATLLFGSDDAAVVWLNGKKVHETVHVRGVNPDEDEVPGLLLKQGRNVLVVKVAQGVGGWGVTARFSG